jgi:hypothetical protein
MPQLRPVPRGSVHGPSPICRRFFLIGCLSVRESRATFAERKATIAACQRLLLQQEQDKLSLSGISRPLFGSNRNKSSVAWGDKVIVPALYGPALHPLATTRIAREDRLADYSHDAYCLCDYANEYPSGGIKFVDSRCYHSDGGEIHCATNAIREIPTDPWWQTYT